MIAQVAPLVSALLTPVQANWVHLEWLVTGVSVRVCMQGMVVGLLVWLLVRVEGEGREGVGVRVV